MNEIGLQDKIKALLKSEKFIDALQLLEKIERHSTFSLKSLSLVYRFYGQLEKEIILFDENRTLILTDTYLTSRSNKLDGNLTGLLSPRKILSTSRTASNVVIENIISEGKLCFVVPSNEEYFSLLIECLSSILGCDEFVTCPIFVANCGLSIASISALKSLSHRIDIIEVDKVLAANGIALNLNEKYLSALLFRGFFEDLFIDFEYCFYLDSDAWIQDQSCIYDYINLAAKQDIAVPRHPFNVEVSEESHWLNRGTLTPQQKEFVIGHPAIINCCCCVKIKSKAYKDYKETLIKNITLLGACWGMDQEVLLYITAKYKLEVLPIEYAYEGTINLKIEEHGAHHIYSKSDKLIKIFHLGGGLKHKDRKWNYFTIVDWVYSVDKKIQLRTSTHFYAPECENRDWITAQLLKIANSLE